MTELILDKVTFGYSDERDIFTDIDLRIDKPQLLTILGPNGVGKSTLIHCINRILHPRSGKVMLDGTDVADYPTKELAKMIGYVPCSSGTTFPMSVADTVMMGRYPHSGSRRTEKDLRIVYNSLSMLGIEDLAMRSFAELSAGQHQKVMLARGLAQESEILLLDEPTSNLDIKHQMNVTRLLKELADKRGMIVVMICHDLNIASRYSDRIVMLHEGRIFADGTPDKVLTAENIESVYGVSCQVVEFEGRPHVMLCDSGVDQLVLSDEAPVSFRGDSAVPDPRRP